MAGANFSMDDAGLRDLASENLFLLPLFELPEACPIPDTSPPAASPLVVDLDGTLILTDSLVESVLQLIKARPFAFFSLGYYLCKGRARFKNYVAENTSLWIHSVP